MNNINVSTSSKKVFLTTLILLLIGAPLLFYVAQQQQTFQNFAWATKQSAKAACTEQGTVSLTVSFTNDEPSKGMKVTAKDLQTGKTVDMGTIDKGETGEEIIATGLDAVDKGAVLFTLKWADGSSGVDTRSATYEATEECPPPPPYCPNDPEERGLCKWSKLSGASNYDVEVIDVETGDIVDKDTLAGDKTEFAFDMLPGKTYQCKVTPQNSCGPGTETESPEKMCEPPKPTPSVCPYNPEEESVCRWDDLDDAAEYHVIIKDEEGEIIEDETVEAPANEYIYKSEPGKTYTCSVSAINECSENEPVESDPVKCQEGEPTPTPTTPPGEPTPTPTVPETPTGTPVPPTPTPTVTPPPPTPTVVVVTATPPPKPTPTPVVIVRIPPNYQPPPPQQPQQPRVGAPVVQQPPAVVQQPPAVVQQPPAVVQQQPPAQQTTPVPTIPPTGALSDSLIMVGSSVLLLLVGGLLFFAI